MLIHRRPGHTVVGKAPLGTTSRGAHSMNRTVRPHASSPRFRRDLLRAGGWLAALPALTLHRPASASEANLVLPDLSSVSIVGGTSGQTLLTGGLVICVFGFLFGL